MAQPRYNGQRFTNPLNPLGFHSENRYREHSPLSTNFMSNETHFAENARGNQEFHGLGGWLGGKIFGRGLATGGKTGAKKTGTGLFGRFFGGGGKRQATKTVTKKKIAGEAMEETVETQTEKIIATQVFKNAPVRTAMVKWGAIGLTGTIVGLYGMGIVGDAAEEWVCSMTGCNCDDNATDAGHEEGTDDYTKFVEECQEKAGKRLEKIAYAGIAVVGIIVYLLLRPKKE